MKFIKILGTLISDKLVIVIQSFLSLLNECDGNISEY